MLNTTTCTSTHPEVSSLSVEPSQQTPLDHPLAAVTSYVIGPLDPAHLTTLPAQFTTGDACSLLIPAHLPFPSALLTHPIFQEGTEWGYCEGHSEEEGDNVIRFLNELYRCLADLVSQRDDPELYLWTLGFLFGELTYVAEWDRTLALTGLAHLCFLLPIFIHARFSSHPHKESNLADVLHWYAMKHYRGQISHYRKQGKSYREAQRLALAGCV